MPGRTAFPGPEPEVSSRSTATGSAIASERETLPRRQLLPDAGDGSLHLQVEELLALLTCCRARVGLRWDGEVARRVAVEGRPVDDPVLCVPERDVRGRQLVEPNVLSGDRHHHRGLLAGSVTRILVRR